MHSGWYQVAFVPELESDLTPVTIADRCYVLARTGAGIGLYDAACPHRGANLAYGGELSGNTVVCPFHGKRVHLGDDASHTWTVSGYETTVVGQSVFARLSADADCGGAAALDAIRNTHVVVAGFAIEAQVDPTLVIENAFDTDHFVAVHGVNRSPALVLLESVHGELGVQGRFITNMANEWQDTGAPVEGHIETVFTARAYSPTLIVSELDHAAGHDVVITSATPARNGSCILRVSVGVAPDPDGTIPVHRLKGLISDSRTAFEQDLPVWEHMVPGAPTRLAAGDETVAAFHAFCDAFEGGGAPRPVRVPTAVGADPAPDAE